MSGFDTGPYGSTPYGGETPPVAGAGPPVGTISCVPLTLRAVRVLSSVPMPDWHPGEVGDAANPASWLLDYADASRSIPVAQVTQVDVTRTLWDVVLLDRLGSFSQSHRMRCFAAGFNPAEALFFGIGDGKSEADDQAGKGLARDLYSAATPRSPSARLRVASSGDYAGVRGAELVRKLVLRRLTTRRGAFFHLPKYGGGLRVKELLPTTDLPTLRREIEVECRMEREVVAASCQIRLSAEATIFLIQLKLDSNASLQLRLEAADGNLLVS